MNWSLISSILTPSTVYTSTAERRTPWECFERWVGFEGIPVEMQKTAYFRAYSSRVSNAQRIVMDQQSQQMQQQNNGGANTPIRRPRTIQPLRVERRKNTKHLALIDAMRKLAKKRESGLQKQKQGQFWVFRCWAVPRTGVVPLAEHTPCPDDGMSAYGRFFTESSGHLTSPKALYFCVSVSELILTFLVAAGQQALRKAAEVPLPRGPVKTPQDFSRMKYEREKTMQERQEAYRQQIFASQQVSSSPSFFSRIIFDSPFNTDTSPLFNKPAPMDRQTKPEIWLRPSGLLLGQQWLLQ